MPDRRRGNPENAEEFADYAASLTAELAALARRYELETLADLLEMARLEALAAAGGDAPKAN